jgi:hypothetical protein
VPDKANAKWPVRAMLLPTFSAECNQSNAMIL